MLSLSKRSSTGLSLNVQYTLGKSSGNTGGSNEALTAGNNARQLSDFEYDNGYNNFDVRHTFNLQRAVPDPYGRNRQHAATGFADAMMGGWDVGGIINARSGLPINVLVTRPDIVYLDAAGQRLHEPGGRPYGRHQHAGRRRRRATSAGRIWFRA